jgi:flavin-dependent dehydrogenase
LAINMPGVAWGISRYALDAALAAAAEQRGAELWSGATVTGYQQSNGKVVVELRRRQAVGQTKRDENETSIVQTRAVIMACGRHTWAALLPGIKGQRTHSQARNLAVGIKSHFTNLAMPDQVELYLFEGGYIGLNRVENGRVNVCALASYPTFARAGRSPRAMIQAAAQWNPAFGQRLRNAQAVPDTECSVAGVDTRRAAMPWANLPLVGDTAAMIAPLCGDGMAMALRSAEVCGALIDGYLRSAFSWHELGRRYNRLWHQEFDHRLRLGRLLEKILQRPLTADLLFRTGATLPFLANYLVRATRGIGN